MPDGGGEGQDALEDAGVDALGFAAAVAFEVELGFEGLVDRFDDLAEWAQELLSGSGGLFRFEWWSDEGDADGVEFGFEGRGPVALVRDDDLAVAVGEGRGRSWRGRCRVRRSLRWSARS